MNNRLQIVGSFALFYCVCVQPSGFTLTDGCGGKDRSMVRMRGALEDASGAARDSIMTTILTLPKPTHLVRLRTIADKCNITTTLSLDRILAWEREGGSAERI